MDPGNRHVEAIAYTEQLKISMPKWLLDKDQVRGSRVGGHWLCMLVESSNFNMHTPKN